MGILQAMMGDPRGLAFCGFAFFSGLRPSEPDRTPLGTWICALALAVSRRAFAEFNRIAFREGQV
jgi:hypothetical protein